MDDKDKGPPMLTVIEGDRSKTIRPRKIPEFVNTIEREIDGETVILVNARDLHAFLGARRNFTTWMPDRVAALDLVEGTDLLPLEGILPESGQNSPNKEEPRAGKTKSSRGRPRTADRLLPIELAKRIAMMEETERGDMVRDYFLDTEKRYHQLLAERNQAVMAQTVQQALDSQAGDFATQIRKAAQEAHKGRSIPPGLIDPRIMDVIEFEIIRRMREERRDARTRKAIEQQHYRLVSLRRYYKWRGVGDEMSRTLAARATFHLLTFHRESMIPIDEGP